ncbi:hypothetical protein D3C73_682980 [compost metagenome]
MIVEQLVVSFIASAAFAILFNVPKGALLQCGFVGSLGWLLYINFREIPVDPVLATLVASFIVAVTSQIFAKLYKTPIIVFSVSGIIPLVPGGLAYDAMRNVIENEYNLAVELAARAFILSGEIDIGLVFSEVINPVIRKTRN